MKNTILTISIIAITVGAVVFAGTQAEQEQKTINYKSLYEAQTQNYERMIKANQDEVLETLQKCETGTVKEPNGAIILDTNKRMSIGRFMFQRRTVKYFYKKIYGEEINNAEAIAIAIDEEKVTELARKILFEEKDGYKHWLNCAKKHNLKDKIEIIKNLYE